MKSKIVVIDDEIKLLKVIKRALEIDGYDVYDFSDSNLGLGFIEKKDCDLVISDIRMRGMNGLDLLSRIKTLFPNKPVILMTAYSSMETAVTAVKLGASDYLLKPFEVSELKESVVKILNKQKLGDKPNRIASNIIGKSDEIVKILEIIDNISDTDSTILITGESGTGKELVAKSIHNKSLRAAHPFIAINCSAIPESLFESEVFGHKKGSFTGAIAEKKGFFQEAEGGTLFLDEIGDLPLSNQAKLLRVLQDGTYRLVGSSEQINSNVRILCATNKNLSEEVKKGNFREDLLYRINIVEIEIPPLRKRRSDIKPLAEHFISYYSKKHNRNVRGATEDFFDLIENYGWPGNIRQLENLIERAVIMRRTELLDSSDLKLPATSNIDETNLLTISDAGIPLSENIDKFELALINQALQTTNGNFSKAASLLGITRQNLNYKLKKYKIHKEA